MLAFQESYGLQPTGHVTEDTWSALIEASWSLGERLLYLRSPNIRGDDVAELQSRLNRMGFDCGRVDGIYGPATTSAVADFQANTGMDANGVCSPQVVSALHRIGSQSGEGPGVAMVREASLLLDQSSNESRLVIGHFPGCAGLAHALERRCRLHDEQASTVDSNASLQARTANEAGADCYIGFESSAVLGMTVHYYEVPTFTSVGGLNLARRIVHTVNERIPEIPARAEGLRHPVLRETRMPAVLCVVGSPDIVGLKQGSIVNAVHAGWASWVSSPVLD